MAARSHSPYAAILLIVFLFPVGQAERLAAFTCGLAAAEVQLSPRQSTVSSLRGCVHWAPGIGVLVQVQSGNFF